MFKNLFDLSYKRTKWQAFGFLIVYGILISLLFALFNVLMFLALNVHIPADFKDGFKLGLEFGKRNFIFFSLVASAALNIAILLKKGIGNKVSAVIVAIFGVLLMPLFGAFIGLIPSAVLTTFDSANENAD